MNEEACRVWIQNGFSEVPVKSLNLRCVPSWLLPLFLEHCRPQKLNYQCHDDEEGVDYPDEDYFDFDMNMQNTNEENDDDGDDFIENFQIYLQRTTTQATLHMIANLLCKIRVKSLILNTHNLPTMMGGKHHDLFKSAKYCDDIIWECDNDDTFPCDGLASLVHKDGNLKHLRILSRESYYHPRFGHIEKFLKMADLSFLERFRIHSMSNKCTAFTLLCNQLAENKGPRALAISFEHIDGNGPGKYIGRDNEELEKFGICLTANTKIEELEIELVDLDVTATVLLQFIQRVGNMPRLTSFELNATPKCRCNYLNKIESMVKNRRKHKRAVLQHIAKSNTIEYLSLPFDDDGLGNRLDEIAMYRDLLCCGNDVSDAIWAHALGRVDNTALDVMFYIVKQMPRLLQPKATEENEPLFTVPHHPNCPGCRRHFELQVSKRARIL